MTETLESRLARAVDGVQGDLDLEALRTRVRRRRRRVLLQRGAGILAVLVLLGGVPLVAGQLGNGDDRLIIATEPSPPRTPTAGPVRVSDAQQFVDRLPLRSCGTVDLGQGQQPSRAMPEVRCLLEAVGERDGAELRLSRPTLEGKPIVAWYRAIGNQRIEVYRDTTADDDGVQRWTYETCVAASGPNLVRDCSAPVVLAAAEYPPCGTSGMSWIASVVGVGGAMTPRLAADQTALREGTSTDGWLMTRPTADEANELTLRNAGARVTTWQGTDGTWFVVSFQRCA